MAKVAAGLPEHRALKAVQLREALRNEQVDLGRLVDTAAADAGAAEAIVEMRAAFAQARPDQAERLAAELGLSPDKVRVLRAGLKRFERMGQECFARRMGRALIAAEEDGGRAAHRLRMLAETSLRLRGLERLEPASAI